jgi:hypothetical protein
LDQFAFSGFCSTPKLIEIGCLAKDFFDFGTISAKWINSNKGD